MCASRNTFPGGLRRSRIARQKHTMPNPRDDSRLLMLAPAAPVLINTARGHLVLVLDSLLSVPRPLVWISRRHKDTKGTKKAEGLRIYTLPSNPAGAGLPPRAERAGRSSISRFGPQPVCCRESSCPSCLGGEESGLCGESEERTAPGITPGAVLIASARPVADRPILIRCGFLSP